MELSDFLVHFAEQFEDTNPAEITAKTNFKSLDEWSSLLALAIIAMVNEEYDVTLKGADIRNAETVEDLYNLVKCYNE